MKHELENASLQLNRKEGEAMLTVEVMVNRHKAKNKEHAKRYVGAMKNNSSAGFLSEIKEVTIDQLADNILLGKTIIPAVLKNGEPIVEENFQHQQLFMIDIDDADCGLEELIGRFKDYEPCMVYTSFSHTPEQPKYRFVFMADKVIEDIETARKINLALMKIAKCADEKCKDVSRLFFAGKSIVYKKEVTFDSDKLLKEVNVEEQPITLIEAVKASIKASESKPVSIEAIKGESFSMAELEQNLDNIDRFRGTVVEYKKTFDWFNENVKLTEVLGKELNQKFRCLLDAHEDNHPSASIVEHEGKQYYRCSCDEFYKPKSLLDTLLRLFSIDKITLVKILAKHLGITVGSEYQQSIRDYVSELRINRKEIIAPETPLDKYMRFLYGAYFCMADFVADVCPASPITKDESIISFFMSSKQLEEQMRLYNMKGASCAKNKIDQLKEIGLIRPLREDELKPVFLEKSKEVQNMLKQKLNTEAIKRVECYELVKLDLETIRTAELIIEERKRVGIKKKRNNSTRRANALGIRAAQEMHVQIDIMEKIESKEYIKRSEKMTKCAEELIQEQGYFTVADLRKKFDPKRRIKKAECEKIIDDYIPFLINEFGYEKSRVKNETRKKFNIPAKTKTNTIIFFR